MMQTKLDEFCSFSLRLLSEISQLKFQNEKATLFGWSVSKKNVFIDSNEYLLKRSRKLVLSDMFCIRAKSQKILPCSHSVVAVVTNSWHSVLWLFIGGVYRERQWCSPQWSWRTNTRQQRCVLKEPVSGRGNQKEWHRFDVIWKCHQQGRQQETWIHQRWKQVQGNLVYYTTVWSNVNVWDVQGSGCKEKNNFGLDLRAQDFLKMLHCIKLGIGLCVRVLVLRRIKKKV